jgi:dimethylaniline monooxygenase (N-oxide forming)
VRRRAVGGTFVNKAYDDAALVSSKFLTAFSDLRSPESDPPHLSLPQYVSYLRKYADTFGLWRHVTFGARVLAVERCAGGGYDVRLEPSDVPPSTPRAVAEAYPPSEAHGAAVLRTAAHVHFDAVAICSGLHEAPYVPTIAGLDTFTGERTPLQRSKRGAVAHARTRARTRTHARTHARTHTHTHTHARTASASRRRW